MLGGSLPDEAPRPDAQPRAHSNDENVTMVNVASVDHLVDMSGRDNSEYDASGDQVGSHQPPVRVRDVTARCRLTDRA